MGSLLGREHSPPPTSRNECPHGRKTHLVLFPISAFNCSVLECVRFCSHLDSYWFRHLTNAANRTFGAMAHGALPAGSPVSSGHPGRQAKPVASPGQGWVPDRALASSKTHSFPLSMPASSVTAPSRS